MTRINFEMTAADLAELLDSMKPVSMIALNCGTPSSRQENANAAWARLGQKMGFDSSTVQPTGRGDRFFSAVQTQKPEKPHIVKDGNEWCAREPGFIDLQVSRAGFGSTPSEALADLEKP